MKYSLGPVLPEFGNKPTHIIREDGSSIPINAENADYQDFLEWNKTQEVPLEIE